MSEDKGRDWTIAQVAERFSCKPQTVINWVVSGRLKAYRLGGDGAYRVPCAEVERAKSEWMYRPRTDSSL